MVKEKSRFVVALDAIQKEIAPLFKSNKFAKSGRTYNRTVNDGIVHVINFQAGEFPIGDYVIPGLRENLYGKFAINLGVFIPKLKELEYGMAPKSFIKDYDCTIRARLRENPEINQDQWFDPVERETTKRTFHLIDKDGLTFLNKYSSISKIIEYYNEFKYFPSGNRLRSKLDVILIYVSINEIDKAKLITDELLKESDHKGFSEHVTKVALKLGLK